MAESLVQNTRRLARASHPEHVDEGCPALSVQDCAIEDATEIGDRGMEPRLEFHGPTNGAEDVSSFSSLSASGWPRYPTPKSLVEGQYDVSALHGSPNVVGAYSETGPPGRESTGCAIWKFGNCAPKSLEWLSDPRFETEKSDGTANFSFGWGQYSLGTQSWAVRNIWPPRTAIEVDLVWHSRTVREIVRPRTTPWIFRQVVIGHVLFRRAPSGGTSGLVTSFRARQHTLLKWCKLGTTYCLSLCRRKRSSR